MCRGQSDRRFRDDPSDEGEKEMKHERGFTRRLSCCLLILVASAISVAGQGPKAQKRFLNGPLVLEDQGSFFVGGVQKITDYATLPPAPGTPGIPPTAA